MAKACIYLMENFNPTKKQNKSWDIFLNIWTWKDVSIKELALTIQKIAWFKWNIIWDIDKPNWTIRKLQDVSKLNKIWWKYEVKLKEWIKKSYEWFLKNK
jgi:GDP-L-fucose synthase